MAVKKIMALKDTKNPKMALKDTQKPEPLQKNLKHVKIKTIEGCKTLNIV